LAFGQTFVKLIFGEVFRLTDEGWRVLTIRWALFFVFLAVLNEIIWRNFTTDFWISFKVWGVMPITMAFAIAQVGLLKRYEVRAES
jgi:intracellular septation protein